MTVERYGREGVMVRGEGVRGDGAELEGLVEWVAGDGAVLFVFEEGKFAEEGMRVLGEVRDWGEGAEGGRVVEIPVRYEGGDLEEVARVTGMTVEEVVAVHVGGEYEVGFMGFTPGFGYLRGLDERLVLPRREVPRERIEVGSVAIGGEYAGVYSVASPGGWHVLGRTEVEMFSVEREEFLLEVGDRVKFVAL